jgi:hypothetical protein
MPLHVSSTCAHCQEVKIVLYSLWYPHTYRWPSRAPVESSLCRKCSAEEETSAHVLCIPTCFFFRGGFMGAPEDVRNLSLGAICIFIKGWGSCDGDPSLRGTKA